MIKRLIAAIAAWFSPKKEPPPPPESTPITEMPKPSGELKHVIGPTGLELIKHFEGCYLTAYNDNPKNPQNGTYTLGWGRIKYDDGSPVKPGDVCTQEDADKWLMHDLEDEAAQYMRKWIKVPLTDYQWDALASFCYNRGCGNFQKDILPYINIKDFKMAMKSLMTHTWAGKKKEYMPGLERRRFAEREMFEGRSWEKYKK